MLISRSPSLECRLLGCQSACECVKWTPRRSCDGRIPLAHGRVVRRFRWPNVGLGVSDTLPVVRERGEKEHGWWDKWGDAV